MSSGDAKNFGGATDVALLGSIIREFVLSQIVRDPSAALDFQTPLRDAGYLDSLGLLDLLTFIETSFDLELPDYFGDSPSCRSVETIAIYVQSRLSERNG